MPILALLAGAIVWGIIWYPYRILERAAISGEFASFITYGVAFALGSLFFAHGRSAIKS